ncbi:hypothetical protein [Nonomuraea rhodomycinica]|uniref:YCII-related domain-containing protein n=1 Tax=Nonomuraea rhodomycinica TaxID=1712872 RepID=A0A7Y6IJW8_9ACTN|nr:hypothetical protein [Nonomuraea rhodomycinica]NUW39493.1 hypothetical protein [Nonomuraea rhodomycinica]
MVCSRSSAPGCASSSSSWGTTSGPTRRRCTLVGGIQPGLGGAILAADTSREELESRVAADPFVAEDVVSAEIVEIAPWLADDRLKFLLA